MSRTVKRTLIIGGVILAVLCGICVFLFTTGIISVSDIQDDNNGTEVGDTPISVPDIEVTDDTLDLTGATTVHSNAMDRDLDLVFPEYTVRSTGRTIDGTTEDGYMLSENSDLRYEHLNEVEGWCFVSTKQLASSYIPDTDYNDFISTGDDNFNVRVFINSDMVADIAEKINTMSMTVDEYGYVEPVVASPNTEYYRTLFTFRNNLGVGMLSINGMITSYQVEGYFTYDDGTKIAIKGVAEDYSKVMQYITDIIENGLILW